jgi:hypothetical protein
MLKKILHSFVLIALALEMGTFLCVGHLQAATTPPPPSSDIRSTDFTFDLGVITNTNIKKKGWIEKGINYFFERIIGIMATVAGSVAVLMMSIGGFRMIVSAGDETAYKNGKSMIIRSGIGLVFVLGAYLLVVTVQLLIKGIYGA